ncbi:MAG: hypothetical protein KAJ19_20560 [Gammaproteobacteria bacterium]|nr:hypothetical protein [Gammaproteobacteria bacterium]
MGTKGCFGHIATYNPVNKICQSCNDSAACDESVSDRAQRLRKLGVSVELSKQKPSVTEPLVKPEQEPRPVVSHMAVAPAGKRGIMTVKAKETYASIEKRGVDLKAGLMGLFNPLQDKPKFLALAFDHVLTGGYQKRELAEKFCRTFEWTRGTANSHVGICTSIFTALNLSKADGQTVKTIGL